MNNQPQFLTKILYLVIAAALFYPLYWLGHPGAFDEQRNFHGGVLAEYRQDPEHRLNQTNLGEVDPVSESFKLATIGLRPVAVVLLWEKAHYYKKTEDWSNLEATINQITKLQPNFIKTWDFLSHEISYNLSVEFDDWRDRYYYVIKGLNFLIQGTEYNTFNSLLLAKVGWFTSQKIGKSDEKVLYRRAFAKDKERLKFFAFKLGKESISTDNWLVGKEWYLKAVEATNPPHNSPVRNESPVIFHSKPGMQQISYADNLEEDGIFDDRTKRAWDEAATDWTKLGNRVFDNYSGGSFKLSDQEVYEKRVDDKIKKFAELVGPNLKQKLMAEKRAKLTAEERRIIDLPSNQRNQSEDKIAEQIEERVAVTNLELANQIPAEKRQAMRQLASEIEADKKHAESVAGFRSHVNYEWWRVKCDAELTAEAIEAHRLIYQALKEQRESSLTDGTKARFEQGFAKWRVVFDKFPYLFEESIPSDELIEHIKLYRKLLADRGEEFPADFILIDLWKKHEQRSAGQ